MTKAPFEVPYIKMHGLGNDYVYLNGFDFDSSHIDYNRLARHISHRHFGVGGDGLVCILPSDIATVKMRMFNADGTEAEMCGNAIRCVAGYCYSQNIESQSKFSIETLAGLKNIHVQADGLVRVNMGQPIFDLDKIPVELPKSVPHHNEGLTVYSIQTRHFTNQFFPVSMGNPHAVYFLNSIEDLDLEKIGPDLEHHPYFPERVNSEFIKIINNHEITFRVWERGAGETWACGTGAAAAVAAAISMNRVESPVVVHLKGGDLQINYDQNRNEIEQIGPYHIVSEGIYYYNPSDSEGR